MQHSARKSIVSVFFVIIGTHLLLAQPDRWQQRVEYTMDINMNVNTHQFTGSQELVYYNNSPDTLDKVFYHLYFNAFQPGSMMDVRSRTIDDPDSRVVDRIFHLKENETGFQKIHSLKMDGKKVQYHLEGTILEVAVPRPILPGKKATFEMEFTGQVPLQVRRSGRHNSEGIDYSMSQWYPKMAEYDYQGWHANPYIGREFHGVWGDFDVKITIDSSYTIGASGYLQNPQVIGHGYQAPGQQVKRSKGDKLTWHFKAPNVHDFVWAADPDYVHKTAQVPNGPTLHFFYKIDTLTESWEKLPGYTIKTFEYMNEHFGKYPYEQYSVIQGGDGGMEYAMATLITGHRSLKSLVGVTVHEAAHSWYQHVLATNESLYPWMDEGFTSYATDEVMNFLFDENQENPHRGSYYSYFNLVKSGLEEPMTSHADHYHTNRAYGAASYSKGAVLLYQLSYIVGKDAFDKGMKRYFNTWKFKHPNPNDFKRIMEKTSGLELDWYFEHFVNTTNTIDYGIKSVIGIEENTSVTMERIGRMMMPIDLYVQYKDGSEEYFYIPLTIMRGEKDNEYDINRTAVKDWPWTHPTYTLNISREASEISHIEIDPSERMADIDRSNNSFTFEDFEEQQQKPSGGNTSNQ